MKEIGLDNFFQNFLAATCKGLVLFLLDVSFIFTKYRHIDEAHFILVYSSGTIHRTTEMLITDTGFILTLRIVGNVTFA